MRPLLWALMGLLRGVTFLAGLFMVPLMLWRDGKPAWLFRPWHDPTGIASWWPRVAQQKHWLARTFPNFWWYAVRNNGNGLRTYPWITVERDVDRLRWKDNGHATNPAPLRLAGGRIGWFYAWQGVYSGMWVCIIWTRKHHTKLRWGWKIVPEDEQFEDEWKPERAGFAMSTLLWRKG